MIKVKKISDIAGNNDGFTLIEILVASAIAALIMVMVVSSYYTILKSIRRTTGLAEFYENINLAISKIDLDISNTYYTKLNKKVSFVAEEDGENSKFNFVTVNHSDYNIIGSMNTSNPVTDVKEIGYYLEPDNETEGLYKLIKREQNNYDDDPENGGTESVLLYNVVGLSFQFRLRNDWTPRWDSRQNNTIPKAVKVTLKVKDYQAKEETFEYISFINTKK